MDRTTYRPPAWRRFRLAELTAALSLLGCVGVYWAETAAYARPTAGLYDRLVGVKGDCCVPGAKVACSSQSPFACSPVLPGCDSGSAFDQCGTPHCQDSDDRNDACAAEGFGMYSVSVDTCHVIEGAEAYCPEGGTRCMYVQATATVDFNGCGQNSICAVTQGPACQ